MEPAQAPLTITAADFPEVLEPYSPPDDPGRVDAQDVIIYSVKYNERQAARLLAAAKAKYPGRRLRVQAFGHDIGFVPNE